MLTQALPLLITLIFLIYTFKFAIMAELNPGSITTLFSLNSVYVAILFYFCFDEKLSKMKIVGVFLMVACAITLGYDSKVEQA